jgi:hypothetical protein
MTKILNGLNREITNMVEFSFILSWKMTQMATKIER